MFKTDKNRFFLLAIVFLHLGYFVWQIFHGNYFLRDSYEYLHAAANLNSDFLLYSGDLTKPIISELFTRRPPIYPLFLAVCQLISPSMVLVLILQNILSIAGIYLIRKIILKYGYSDKYDILFIVLLFLTPAQFIYANMIMSDTLFQFFIILLVWFFIKYMNENRNFYGFLYSIALALSVLTKPVLVYFIFVNVLFFLWISFKRVSLKPLLLGFIPLVFLFTYQYRNYRQTGVFELSSIVTANVLDFNINFFLAQTKGKQTADSSISAIDSISALQSTYKDKVTFKKQHITAIITQQPVRFFIYHTKGITGFFLDPGRFDLVNFFNLNAEKTNGLLYLINQVGLKGALEFLLKHAFLLLLCLAIIFIFNILKFLLIIGFIFQRHINKYLKWFILFLIFYVAFLTGPIGVARYMMPLVPLYIGCGLIFLSRIFNQNSENSLKNILFGLFLKSTKKKSIEE
jgi:4-amino-4-deoxy-L-arabinose transferase-like glycosyltransferase